jgi:hypothetical protein
MNIITARFKNGSYEIEMRGIPEKYVNNNNFGMGFYLGRGY